MEDLFYACERGDLDTVKLLLRGEFNHYCYRNSALSFASNFGQLEIVKWLLRGGALININAQDKYGMTALIIASENGHLEIVKWLLRKGADVNVKDMLYRRTALNWALLNHYPKIAKYLENWEKYISKNILSIYSLDFELGFCVLNELYPERLSEREIWNMT